MICVSVNLLFLILIKFRWFYFHLHLFQGVLTKTSGATGFEVGDDYIIIEFGSPCYKYTYSSCGRTHVETMKRLAIASTGLSTYVTQNKPPYESKW